ncbi:MAG TPA: neutral zinc metallopeptidase [Hyphomicrobiaceae bacterium]|nr:neutral zinc metallopeptidase [Hyphomicrobiaceae bacterium]
MRAWKMLHAFVSALLCLASQTLTATAQLTTEGAPPRGLTATVPPTKDEAPPPISRDDEVLFLRRVLADTEDVWEQIFQTAGRHYPKPKLVVFSELTNTRCGMGEAAIGPFYCSSDHAVYLDLDFFRALREEYHAPDNFAQAYIIAHEIGHHVQNVLGIAAKVEELTKRADRVRGNALSVRVELQADCLAGVWAYRTNQMRHSLEPGDIESGLNAASQIGDDTLQKRDQGIVVPETFTHGTSAQRMRWFHRGLDRGESLDCNTFEAKSL